MHLRTRSAIFRGEWNNFIALRLLEIADLERTFVDELLARHPMVAPTEIG